MSFINLRTIYRAERVSSQVFSAILTNVYRKMSFFYHQFTRFSASDGALFKTTCPQFEYFIEYIQSSFCETGCWDYLLEPCSIWRRKRVLYRSLMCQFFRDTVSLPLSFTIEMLAKERSCFVFSIQGWGEEGGWGRRQINFFFRNPKVERFFRESSKNIR